MRRGTAWWAAQHIVGFVAVVFTLSGCSTGVAGSAAPAVLIRVSAQSSTGSTGISSPASGAPASSAGAPASSAGAPPSSAGAPTLGIPSLSAGPTPTSAKTTAPTRSVSTSPHTAVGAPVPASQLPVVTGGFGVPPTLRYPPGQPPDSLQRAVLHQGQGRTVVKGDFIVVKYLSAIWGGKVFDSSFTRAKPFTVQIGTAQVISGWDLALVNQKVGSRVLLSVPPVDGYGSAGSPTVGVRATDTMVFVIDVVGDVAASATGQPDAVPQQLPSNVPSVGGELGQEPTITIPAGLAEPTDNRVYLVARGSGRPVTAGTVLAQLVVTDWKQTQTQSTWPRRQGSVNAGSTTGLQQFTVTADSPIAGLIGVPLGSRVLLVIGGPNGSSAGATVGVIDLVAQP